MESATDILKHEHQVILLVLDGAERTAAAGDCMDLDLVAQMVDFFRNFADRCHHAKEEGYLFPLLIERGLPRDEGPVHVMLTEHDQGRAHVRAIAAEVEQPTEADKQVIAAHLAEYVALLRAHIGKEDNVLFPLADQLLSVTEQETLHADFERVEEEELGAGVHEKYHQLAHELSGN